MANSTEKTLLTTFDKGLWKDSLHSLQPQGTWRDAWAAVVDADDENGFGLSNEPSDELLAALPGDTRGLLYVEERDYFLVFLKGKKQEIGIIDEIHKCYRTVVDETQLQAIGACDTEWIDVTAKTRGSCNHLWVYWSAKDEYRRVNIDDPCCKFEETKLFKISGIGPIVANPHEAGGGLPNGKYGFAARLRDLDGNDTNWYPIQDFVSVAGGDYKPGENSGQSIELKLEGLHKDYNTVDLAVVAIIDNLVSIDWFDTVSYGENRVNYLYRGKTGREIEMKLEDITGRNPKYFYGKNLIQYDGRLMLYNIRNENNIDYQRQANEIRVKYTNNVVPTRYAHQYVGLRPNENYWIAIRWNFTDGTHSADFLIPGRAAGGGDTAETDSCRDGCALPAWRVKDTSSRTATFFSETDLVGSNNNNQDEAVYTDPVSNEEDVLYADETTVVQYDEKEDAPNPDDLTDELDYTANDLNALLDCICPRVEEILQQVIQCNFGPGGDGCDQVALYNMSNLIQIACMCETRSVSEEGGDTDGDGTDDGGGGTEPPIVIEGTEALTLRSDSTGSGSNICVDGSCGGGCSGGCGGSGCSSTSSSIPLGSSCSSGRCSGCSKTRNEAKVAWEAVGTGRTPVRAVNYAINKTKAYVDELKNSMEDFSTKYGDKKYLDTAIPCSVEGRKKCNGPSCMECSNGTWKYINNADRYPGRPAIGRSVRGDDSIEPNGDGFSFENIYDEDGCTVIGVKPRKFSEGNFGYWETRETYPETENCECQKIYGDLAGKNVRLHRVPSVTKEPHFVSFSGGVPNQFDSGNDEDKNSFTFFIGLKLENITPPTNLPKPLNPSHPFTITYVERTEGNKSVLGSAIGISCFKGEIQGEFYAFPKHGVNSFERFDRSIEPTGTSSFRGGSAFDDASPYVLHSPDFHMRRPPLDATDCLIELELNGKGFRHGIFAEGEAPDDPKIPADNQKGTRQSLNLNHYSLPVGSDGGPVVECVKKMAYVPADTIMSKSDEFSYSLCNLWRESSVYMELERSTPYPLHEEGATTANYGGATTVGDGASDRSFTGDTLNHEMPIHDVRANYMTFTRYLPYQYGSPIAQAYIPIGLEGTAEALASGTIEGVVGDSFVNTMSVKRTSYVSDKTPRKLAKIDDSLGITSNGNKFWDKLFRGILKAIGRSISLKKGGYIPETGDPSEYINMFGGLRNNGDTIGIAGHPGEITNGDVPPRRTPTEVSDDTDHNDGDNYFAQVLKSNVFGWFNADVNMKYRQTGSVDNGEIYYKETKGLKLDASMPFKWDWKKAFLTRSMYTIWKENASWKYLAAAILLFLFTYGIGMWIIVEGFSSIITGISAMGGGTYGLQSIGGALSVVFGIGLVAIGIYWIVKWATSDADNKVVEDMLKIKNCRPDVKNADGSYSLKDGRIEKFENNYWRYDFSHSWVNRFETGYGMSDPYDTCYCPQKRSNRVVYSNKQILTSPIDSWSNFKANNTIDIPTDHGSISKMFQIGNGLYVHTTDMILSLQAGSRELQLNGDNLLLGTGDLFNRPLPIYGGVVEGYGGLKDPNAAILTNWGYIFPDREARKLYTFNGSALPQPISDAGVRGEMQQNFKFRLLEQFPDFKMVDLKSPRGIGYSLGIDHQHSRLIFTKIDYEAYEGVKLSEDGYSFVNKKGKCITLGDKRYFCNKSFTLSYSMSREMWVSNHYYARHLYAWNRFNMYSFTKDSVRTHNAKGSFQEFDGVTYPFVVEFVATDTEKNESFKFISADVDMEVYKWVEFDYLRNPKVFFDSMIAYNTDQSTDIIPFKPTEELSILEKSRENLKRIKIEYKKRRWNYSALTDLLKDKDAHIFNKHCTIGPRTVNSDGHVDYIVDNYFYDNFLGTRYVLENSENDLKVFLKNVRTDVDLEEV
jgi:hypothetical protein